MGDVSEVIITLLGVLGIIVVCVMALCHFMGLWTWTAAWIFSSREEKIGLTRSKGHYNASGYLVHSDSDINLDATGSFKHFDPVDHDFRVAIATSDLISDYNGSPPSCIELQPTAYSQPQNKDSNALYKTTTAPQPTDKLITKNPPNEVKVQPVPTCRTASDGPKSEVQLPPTLQRAMSCDSVCSDSSVILEDLEEPNITGYLCIGLEYDSESSDLVVNVVEAKDLVGPDNNTNIDTYVRVYLLPDKSTNMQTRTYRKTNCPCYKEKFLFGLEAAEFSKRSLMFYIYASDKFSNTMIGEAELKLCDVTPRQPVTTWLTLSDTNQVYMLLHGKKAHKKKTSIKKGERSPIFNEAMIFSVPAHTLQTIQLRVTVAENTGEQHAYSIGHVIVGTQASGKALSHWNQMLSSLRKPIAMWHPLRK
ncbi:hypothetical protein C0J52_18421 [Blattella germanica]|nr:hypothetical protein C0J52_18421 [Blattella germanica]